MNTTQFGYHLTLDLYGCPLKLLNDIELCYEVLAKLPKKLDMRSLIPPYVIKATSNENFGGKDPGGFSGFVIIAESHISVHTFPRRGFVSIDVYSCKIFDYELAVNYFKESFKPKEIEEHRLDRGKKYPVKNIYK